VSLVKRRNIKKQKIELKITLRLETGPKRTQNPNPNSISNLNLNLNKREPNRSSEKCRNFLPHVRVKVNYCFCSLCGLDFHLSQV